VKKKCKVAGKEGLESPETFRLGMITKNIARDSSPKEMQTGWARRRGRGGGGGGGVTKFFYIRGNALGKSRASRAIWGTRRFDRGTTREHREFEEEVA